jgi:hypothetical protein
VYRNQETTSGRNLAFERVAPGNVGGSCYLFAQQANRPALPNTLHRATVMNFNYWDLRQQPAGAIVQVTLQGDTANVRLFDSSNFNTFKAGHRATGSGGHATRSPVRLQVPRSGHWYVVVDYGGYAGRGRATVRVLPGRLPELRERALPSLGRLAESVTALNHDQDELIPKAWDVFISHAHEDKDEIVNPLAHALQETRPERLVRRVRAAPRRQPAPEDRSGHRAQRLRRRRPVQRVLRQELGPV